MLILHNILSFYFIINMFKFKVLVLDFSVKLLKKHAAMCLNVIINLKQVRNIQTKINLLEKIK